MKINGLRWVVLSLIALVTIINYLDRGTLNYMWIANTKLQYSVTDTVTPGVACAILNQNENKYHLYSKTGEETIVDVSKITILGDNKVQYLKKGGIAKDLGLIDSTQSEEEQKLKSKELLSYISIFFMLTYGVSQILSGKLYDKIGTRKGFVISAILWGSADALTSLVKGLSSITFFRAMLGLGEAGPWPGATKSNAEWFPVKERALAQGVFGASASMGSILAPIIIPLLFLLFGWRTAFVVVGSMALLWIIPWLIINKKGPKEHPWITDEEKKYISDGQPENKLTNDTAKSWGELLSNKINYSVIFARFFLDPIWWMFVTWLPIYLIEVFKFDIKQIAASAWVPYVGAAIGSIAGGWFSGKLMAKGHSLNFSRKLAMVIGACVILPAMTGAAFAATPQIAVLYMAFILGGFQFMMTNIQTLASDLHTGKTVGSLAGLGGAAAVLGVIVTMYLVPLITTGGNWLPFFIMGGSLVPLSLLSVFVFASRIAPVYEKSNN